ncbi:hypothetical protein [Lactobacillus isalae]|nr:hypothetical protein [Lactobacillus isalae]
MKDNNLHQICPPRIKPLTPKEQKMMEKAFDELFKEDDCRG